MYPFFSSAFRWHITPLGDEMPNSSQMSRMAGGKPFVSMCLRMKLKIACCLAVRGVFAQDCLLSEGWMRSVCGDRRSRLRGRIARSAVSFGDVGVMVLLEPPVGTPAQPAQFLHLSTVYASISYARSERKRKIATFVRVFGSDSAQTRPISLTAPESRGIAAPPSWFPELFPLLLPAATSPPARHGGGARPGRRAGR